MVTSHHLINADILRDFGTTLLSAAGMAKNIAAEVSDHVIDANLCGIDSHGAIRYPYYLDLIETGQIDPRAHPKVTTDDDSISIVDGGGNLGMPSMRMAADMTAQKAKANGVAAGAVRNVMHTGRIGAYAGQMAQNGCFAFITGGGGHRIFQNVAPFGASQGGFSTNPVAMAFPCGSNQPVVVDFATSATAQGRLMMARATGQKVPDGQILNKHGKPSNDPEDFYDGGVILPAAGAKGSGLALMAELLGHAMLGDAREFNWIVIAIDPKRFAGSEDYQARANNYLSWLRQLRPADGFSEVSIPGEPEAKSRHARYEQGIPLPASVHQDLIARANTLGVVLPAELS